MDKSPNLARPACAAPALAALLLAGCATTTLERAPAAPDQPWHPATTPGGEIIPDRAAVKAPADGASQGYVLPPNPAAAVLPDGPTIDPARDYDLADLIDLAEANNPETRIAWNDARNAALAAGLARSTYLPSITASALGAFQASHGHASTLGVGTSDDVTAGGGVTAISLQWLLFDFGARAATVRAADQDTVIANIRFTGTHQRLIHDVSLAYYAYVAARARVATTDKSLEDAKAVEDAANARYKHGVGTVIEVAQARQASAQAKLARVQAQGMERDTYAALLDAMGLSPLAKIRIAPLAERPLTAALDKPVEDILSSALARRPDVLAAYAAQKAAAARIDAARAAFRPKVFVSGSTAYATGNVGITSIPSVGTESPTLNLSNQRLGATVLGGVSIPLFDGGRRRIVLDQARNNADTARLTMDRVKDEAIRQIVTAQNGLHTALESHEAAQALLDAAQTTYDAALAAYRNEVGSSTDIMVAERQLLEARNLMTDSRSNALSAAATLALATGALGSAP